MSTTVRLIPSTHLLSNTKYMSVTDPSNMYANTDSDTYAVVYDRANSASTTYYLYIRGFNFTAVPDNADVSSLSVKLKASGSNIVMNSSYRPSLANGGTVISGTTASANLSSSVNTISFPTSSITWDQIKGYGSIFSIYVPLKRSSISSDSYISVYGAEIEVTYTPIVYPDTIYYKDNGAWVAATSAYKKVSGVWVEQSDLTSVFDAQTSYIKGDS